MVAFSSVPTLETVFLRAARKILYLVNQHALLRWRAYCKEKKLLCGCMADA